MAYRDHREANPPSVSAKSNSRQSELAGSDVAFSGYLRLVYWAEPVFRHSSLKQLAYLLHRRRERGHHRKRLPGKSRGLGPTERPADPNLPVR